MSTNLLMKKLVESSLMYVAISGYDTIMEKKIDIKERTLSLLVPREVKNSLVIYLQALVARKSRDNYEYLVSTGNNAFGTPLQHKINIFEKGRGIFPERFESELLHNRVIKGNLLHTPDREREFWMTLYVMIVHQGKLDPSERQVVIEQLRSRMGIIRPGYKGFPYFPDPFVPL